MKFPLPKKSEELPADDGFQDTEELDDLMDEEDEMPPRFRIRAEMWLGLVALACVAVLIGMIIISFPFFRASRSDSGSDPEALMHPSHIILEGELKDSPIEEEVTEETTEPTIPPEPNPYNRFDFQFNKDNYLICTKQSSYPGVDVSAFQGKIDWNQVAKSGIKFAMVRLGYRGYGKAGKLVEDEYAKANLEGARAAGLSVGAYFFSQALNTLEVDEEIAFLMNILGDYELDMPLVLDWEKIDEGRSANMTRRTLTDCLLHFCWTMEDKGYQPMVYFNWGQASRLLYLNELEDYPFWLALYQDRMTFPFRVEMWQYTCTGRVPGIASDVDINVYMPDFRPQQIPIQIPGTQPAEDDVIIAEPITETEEAAQPEPSETAAPSETVQES